MMVAGLACSPNTLGTAMDSSGEQDSLGDEPGSSGAAELGESGSAGVDESEGQDTTTTTTTTTTATTATSTDDGCPIGAEGCPCTGGGGCDAGLECDGGVCVPFGASESTSETTDSTTTTESTSESTTTDSGGDPFMCDLSNFCFDFQGDLDTCTCVGCNTNGYCTQSDDCVCPDCANSNACSSCDQDGLCDPYYEACSCSDCAGHPMCG
jgi:hypothetical protein